MGIKDMFNPKMNKTEEEEGESFVEVEPLVDEGKLSVNIQMLKEYTDINNVQQLVREGHVVFLNMKQLREKDMGELKRAVARLKKTLVAMNGDIVGVDEDFLVITPKTAKIYRGKTA